MLGVVERQRLCSLFISQSVGRRVKVTVDSFRQGVQNSV